MKKNHLRNLPDKLFANQSNLEYLNLRDNNLTIESLDVAKSLPDKISLFTEGNYDLPQDLQRKFKITTDLLTKLP